MGDSIYKWSGDNWKIVSSKGFLALAIDPNGVPWAVNKKKKLYKLTAGKKWKFIGKEIVDVAIGADGSVFVLGGKRVKNGYTVQRYRGKKGWKTYPGRVKRIAVDPKGKPWVISSRKNVYEWNGKTWNNYKGPADEIAVGADGSVFMLHASKIHKLDRVNKKWISLKGKVKAIHIAAGESGKPYFVDKKQNVYWPEKPCAIKYAGKKVDCKYDKTDWLPQPYSAIDIAAGDDGSVWIISDKRGIILRHFNAEWE